MSAPGPVNPTTTTKNLGLAAAMVAGTTPPTNTNLLWLNTTTNPNVKYYYDFGSSTWLPLVPSSTPTAPPGTIINIGLQTLFVAITGNDFTGTPGNLGLPYQTISGAYAAAKAMSPTYQNRISIVVFPGKYVDNVTMDTDYISIVAAINQETIFNDSLVNTYVSYLRMRRRCISDATWNITAKNAVIKGIDITSLILKSWPTSDTVLANNVFENMICGNIINDTFGNQITGMFFDVHADTFLASDTSTNVVNSSFIMCGSQAFRSGLATYSSSVWSGGVFNSYFDKCWGQTGSFTGNGGYAYQTNFYKCVCTNNCFGTIQNCTLDGITMGNDCVYYMDSGVLKNATGGSGCVLDFTNSAIIKDSDFGVNFGRNGSLSYVWGNIDNVTSNYTTTGFCNNRNWYGKMRNMFIRTTAIGTSGITVYTPTISSVLQQPSTIENSTIIACYADSTPPITGDVAFISYSKFNKSNSITNTLGVDSAAYNIVNSNFCNYVETVCAIPTGFVYTSGTQNTGAPITFVFSYQMSATRAGSQIQMTDPSGQVTLVNFVGNDGGSTTGTKNVTVATPIAGAYLFKLHTVCAYDGGGNASDVSSWTAQVVANVIVPVIRARAWEVQPSSNFCVLTSLSPQPLYLKLSLQNPQTTNNYVPASGPGNYFNHTEIETYDLYVQFYSDSALTVPATLTSQNFAVYVKSKTTTNIYGYTGSSTTPSSSTSNYVETVQSYQLSGVSGTEYLLASGIQYYQMNESTYSYILTNPLRTNEIINTLFQMFPNSVAQIGQTGYEGWNTLQQYYTDDSSLTGLTKPNISSDGNYVAPVSNVGVCSVAAPTTIIGYNLDLIINKMQLTSGSNVITPSHTTPYDSTTGIHQFVVQRFLGVPTALVINANSYYGGTYTYPGYVICTVVSDDGTQSFNLHLGVQTAVGTFVNITSIYLSVL